MNTRDVVARPVPDQGRPTERGEAANCVRRLLDDHLDAADTRADAPCVHTARETLSYRQIHDRACRAAAAFAAVGVGHGSRVALVLPDSPEYLVSLLGLLRMGAVPVPLATQLAADDYRRILDDCRPALVVAGPEQQPRVREAMPPGCPLWDEVDLSQAPLRTIQPVSPQDPAVVQYTSGSTGSPSGVVHSHRGLSAVLEGLPGLLDLGPSDVCLSSAKLSFGYGFGNSLLFPLSVGASVVLLAETAEAPRVLSLVERLRPTVLFAVPALYSAMLTVLERGAEADLSSVRTYVSAGEPLPASLWERWRERTGEPILNGLGSTECLHVFIATDSGVPPGSSGRVVPGYEAELRDEDGRVLAEEEIGDLWVRGAACSDHYWEDQERTRATMVRGWVRTGDQLRRDAAGVYHFVARSDDVLKVGGFKVSPTEVEDCLLRHPRVRECAVVGVAGKHATTEVVAYVRPVVGGAGVAREGTNDRPPQAELELGELERAVRSDLRRYARETLAPFKRPRAVHVVADLPRTPTGKIARHVLREATAAHGRWSG